MNDEYAIGIDLGSTNFRIGVVSADGVVHERYMEEVGHLRDSEEIVELLSLHVNRLKDVWKSLKGAGVGIPGIIDKERGILHQSPHYPKWNDVRFSSLFGEAFGMPVTIDNDANMIALGEGWKGAGRGLGNFLMVSLGTGIGGAIVLDGKIMHGDRGFAGEFGHMVIEFDGPVCNCGSRGCLEMYASATGLKYMVEHSNEPHKETLLKTVGNNFEKVTPAILYDLAKDGDIFSSVIWKEFGSCLGAGIASLVNALGIFNVVIGGGISRAWDFFISSLEKEFKKRTYKRTGEIIRLHPAELGDDAGIIGAGRTILQPECD